MHRFTIAAVALAAALAAGCSSVPSTRFYVVTPLAGPAAAAGPSPSVVVAAVRLPEYLERPQLVTRSSDNRLQLEEFHQWGGNLAKDLTSVMAENLSALLASDAVIAAPYTMRMRPDFRVEVEVLRFERAGDGRVHLTAKWSLQRGADGTLLASPTFAQASEPLASATSIDLTVAAMSGLYGELSRAIAQAITRQEKAAR